MLLRRDAFSMLVGAAAAAPSPTSAVLFLHGSGDTGRGFQRFMGTVPFVRTLEEAGVQIEFPSAVPRPYTLFGGRTMSVWFDRRGMDPRSPEQTDSVEVSCSQLEAVLDRIVASGVPPAKIVIGGFSMGGGIALQTALRSKHDIGGVFAMSSYLCDDAAIYASMDANNKLAMRRPSLWMAHGAADDFVRQEWGEATATRLRGYGLDVTWRSYAQMRHEIRQDELDDLAAWLSPLVLPRASASSVRKEELRR